ncbi:MAG: hypothetical protein ACKVQS_09475 [Fimbriimonadaceae bacterium]
MLPMVVGLVLLTTQSGFDWKTSGESGPLDKFSMTANFTGNGMPFEGPIPENSDIKVGKGGRVFARVNVEFYVEQYGKNEEVWSNTCGNMCQGPPPVHKSHEECDRFCDSPCETTHKFESLAHEGFCGWRLSSVEQPFTEAFADAAMLFRKRGMAVDENLDWLTNIRDEFITKANEKAANEKFVFEPKHVGQTPYAPCLTGKFTVSTRKERVMANVMKDLVFQEASNGGYVTVYEMPMGDDVQIPVTQGSDAISGVTTETMVRCLCGNDETALMEDQPAIQLGDHWRTIPISNTKAGFETIGRNMKRGDTQIAAFGESMNGCSFEITGNPMARLYLPAGTLLVPNDNKAQVMILMESYNSSLVASLFPAAKIVRAACTEMSKEEPSPKTKFAIVGANDGNLNRIAEYTANSRFRGPWDQARVWIYTDGATFAEIEKKLNPMISKGTYLFELDRVLKGGISPEKRKKLSSNITLDMIADARCGTTGLNRALPILWKADSKKLMESAPTFAKNWISDSESQGQEMLANVAFFLGIKKQPEARAAARKVLAAVPSNLRSQVAAFGGLESISSGVFSKNKAEVKETVELLKAFDAAKYAKTIELGEERLK